MFKPKLLNSIGFIRSVFLIAFFILIFLASLTYRHIKELDKISDSLMTTYQTSIRLGLLMSYLKDAETGHRGYIITNDSLYLEPLINARKNVNNSFQILDISLKNDSLKHKRLRRIYDLVNKRFSYFEKEFTSKKEFTANFRTGKIAMDSLRFEISSMLNSENKVLNSKNELYRSSNSNTPLIVFSTFLISIFILCLGYLRVIKNYKDLLDQNNRLKIFDESSKQAEIIGKYGSWLFNLEKKYLVILIINLDY